LFGPTHMLRLTQGLAWMLLHMDLLRYVWEMYSQIIARDNLSLARIVERRILDMPTGVLRDVWLALSSLQSRNADNECRLERVWVRWHDNSDPANSSPAQASNTGPNTTPQMLTGSMMTSIGWTVSSGSSPHGHSQPLSYAQSRVEYPTLSVLPPLKSLSVLDIDELDYLDEMSILISKSKDRLRELRVGISAKAVNRDFALAWDGPDLHQVDHKAEWPGANTIGDRRLGGVLGVLLGRVFDIRKKQKRSEKKDSSTSIASSTPIPPEIQHLQIQTTVPIGTQNSDVLLNHIPEVLEHDVPDEDWATKESNILSEAVLSSPSVTFNIDGGSPTNDTNGLVLHPHLSSNTAESAQSDVDSLTALISAHEISSTAGVPNDSASQPEIAAGVPLRRSQSHSQRQSYFSEAQTVERQRLEGKLRLQTLELERVPLSVAVLQKAFDWSVLTNLTILDCSQHEKLWIMLRRHFQPTPLGASHSSSKHGSNTSSQYHLNLKKIHTDAASSALIAFLKETLAPNTLETLFLQDRKRSNATNVTIVSDISHVENIAPNLKTNTNLSFNRMQSIEDL
jgi:hypothetical protein